MPRGRKKLTTDAAAPMEKKPRKPRTTDCEERIRMVNEKIAQLEALNASRKALIDKTEAKLNQRKLALEKSEAMLQAQLAKKTRIENLRDRRSRTPADKKAEKSQMEALMNLLKASGKTPEEVLEALKAE